MAVPLYTSSPINANAPMTAFPMSPSTFAMRYTPASALEEQLTTLAAATPVPISRTHTPDPETTQQTNTHSHSTNASILPSTPPPPLKAQPTTHSSPTRPILSGSQTPSLTRLSIPSTPSPKPLPTDSTTNSSSSYTPTPISQPSSTTPAYYTFHNHNHTHSRNPSAVSSLTPFSPTPSSDSPFTIPPTPGNNPPGYIQNTRDSFDDRPVADVEEQTFSLPRIPGQHQYRKSYAGQGILNGEMDDWDLGSSGLKQKRASVNGYGGMGGLMQGEDEGRGLVWEFAGQLAKGMVRTLEGVEEGVWRVVGVDR